MAPNRRKGSGRKSARKRDFKAEYRARVARAEAKGLSRSQGRGHARAHETPVTARVKVTEQDQRLALAVRELRKHRSLQKAAKAAGVSPERLRRLFASTGIAEKRGQIWIIGSAVPRWMPLYSDGTIKQLKLKTRASEAIVARYMNAAKVALKQNDQFHLEPFVDRFVTDARGKKHRFETDLNVLYELTNDDLDPFELYRIG